MNDYSVLKFGGSSASQPDRIAEIFTEDPEQNRVAVLSAIGKNPSDQNGHIKVTDKLIELEEAIDAGDRIAASEAQEYVIERSREVYSMLGEGALNRVFKDAYRSLQPDNRADGYAWVGEYISARLFAELTGAVHVSPDLRFSGGVLQPSKSIDSIKRTILPLAKSGHQIVTEGFYGYDDASGKIVTLPRGGSDTSGVVYAGALNGQNEEAWINENYTDKAGILSADPDIVPKARLISEMTHEEVREKMHGITERNGVIHGDAIAYASRLGVTVFVKNTFDPSSPGTRITSTRQSDEAHPIIGVSGKDNLTVLDVYDMGMADAKNYLGKILDKVAEGDMSISNVPTGEDRLRLVINTGATEENLEPVCNFIYENALSGDNVEVEIIKNEGAVYIVGQELTNSLTYTKILGKTASILANEGLSMREVISHEKSPSLALTVDGSEVSRIISILHRELIEQPGIS